MSIDFLKKSLENANVQAMLKTIRKCEGTDAPDGYNYLFGSSPHNDRRFDNFATHPNKSFPFGHDQFSTAAGAYQILYTTWKDSSIKLGLNDFSPASQDLIAVSLISQKNCLQKLIHGYFEEVISHISTIWASLPNSPYGQPTHGLPQVAGWYKENGGTEC